MKISELIEYLTFMQNTFGDLKIYKYDHVLERAVTPGWPILDWIHYVPDGKVFTTELYEGKDIPEEDLERWDILYEKVLRIQLDYGGKQLLEDIKDNSNKDNI